MSNLDYALLYAERGMAVFPIYEVRVGADGISRCSCFDGSDCESPGKHPRTRDGVKDASRDPARIRAWWEQNPSANIAVATGSVSGCFVVDIDPRHNGHESWAEFVATRLSGSDPVTREAQTGGGGRHLFFHYPEGGVGRNRAGTWLEGVDVKTDGGYVLVAPSNHISGGAYTWDRERNRISDAPSVLVEELRSTSGGGSAADIRTLLASGERISAGARNETLFRLACSLRRSVGDDAAAVLGALVGVNQTRCDPPLDMSELEGIVENSFDQNHETVEIPSWRGNPGLPIEPVSLGEDDGDGNSGRLWITPNPTPPAVPFETNDKGNGDRLQHWFGEDIRYVPEWKKWLIWDGTYWRPDTTNKIQELAKATARLIEHEMNILRFDMDDEEGAARMGQHKLNSGNISSLVNGPKAASSNDALVVPAAMLDADPDVMNFANGVVNLRTGEVAPHGKRMYCTKQVPYNYNPSASQERWLDFLSDVMPDEDMRRWLQRAMGLTITGHAARFFVVLFGEGGNGKSMFLRALKHALGDDYCTEATAKFLIEAESTELASMQGVRFVTAAELPGHKKLDKELLKRITGEGKIKARKLHQDNVEYAPQMTLWITTNDEPQHEHDRALMDRMKIVRFTQEFAADPQKEIDLYEALYAEAEGILAWCVQGARDFYAESIWTPQAIIEANAEHSDSVNIVRQFALECLEEQAGGVTPFAKVYDDFKQWVQRNGYTRFEVPAGPQFSKALRREAPWVPEAKTMRVQGAAKTVKAYPGWICTYNPAYYSPVS